MGGCKKHEYSSENCKEGTCGKSKCKSPHLACICIGKKPGAAPGAYYNWDSDSAELIKQAKANLRSLRAFGISDCYSTSFNVLQHELGWDTISLTSPPHKRQSVNKKGSSWADQY